MQIHSRSQCKCFWLMKDHNCQTRIAISLIELPWSTFRGLVRRLPPLSSWDLICVPDTYLGSYEEYNDIGEGQRLSSDDVTRRKSNLVDEMSTRTNMERG